MARKRETYWHAIKVFYRNVPFMQELFRNDRYETYYPMMIEEKLGGGAIEYVKKPIVPSLLFVKCPGRYLDNLKRSMQPERFMYYAGTDKMPGNIPDKEMEDFIRATSIYEPGTMYLGNDTAKYAVGDRVRVTEGIYKGMEGYVKRIRHARRFLVCITGVAAVALSNIHPQYLEKIG